jgi:hypothetical protein
MQSIFTDKEITPTEKDLRKALGSTFDLWQKLVDFTNQSYTAAKEKWSFSNAKYGWSFRISDQKRVLVYLLPRDGFFKVALVFGQKATDEILKSTITEKIKTELKNAKVYAEGRGIRIEVTNRTIMNDIIKLISIKISK